MSASILITGASSGLGAALAEIYAAPGVTLFLGGRNQERLDSVAAVCRARGAEVRTDAVDVTDRDASEAWVLACDSQRPLTLLIANAGISGGVGDGASDISEPTRMIFSANLYGVLNTVLPLVARMQARKSGQIALMSSLAAFRGMPGAPAYCGSKAAVRVWGEGLRGYMSRHGVGVTVICPGFVETGMTANNRFTMPFMMGPAQAAAIMKKGIDANKARIAYPWPMSVLTWLLAVLPPAWTDWLLVRSPGK